MGKGSRRNWKSNVNHRGGGGGGGNNHDSYHGRKGGQRSPSHDRRRGTSPSSSSRGGPSKRKDDVWISRSPGGDDRYKDSDQHRGRGRERTPSGDSKASGGRYRSRSPLNRPPNDDHPRQDHFEEGKKSSHPNPHNKKKHRSPKRRRSPSPGYHGGGKNFKKTKRGRSPHFRGGGRERRRSSSPLPRRGDSRSRDDYSPPRKDSPGPRSLKHNENKDSNKQPYDRASSPSTSTRQRSKSRSPVNKQHHSKPRYRSPHQRDKFPPYSRSKKDKRGGKRRKPSPGQRRRTPSRSERSMSPRRHRSRSTSSHRRRRSPSHSHDTSRRSASPNRASHREHTPTGPRSPRDSQSTRDPTENRRSPPRDRSNRSERKETDSHESPRRPGSHRSASPDRDRDRDRDRDYDSRRGGKSSGYDQRKDGKSRDTSPGGNSRRRGSFRKDRDGEHSYPQYPGPKFKKGKNKKKGANFDRRDPNHPHGRRSPPRGPSSGVNAIPRGPSNKSKTSPSFRSRHGQRHDNDEARRRSQSFDESARGDVHSRDGQVSAELDNSTGDLSARPQSSSDNHATHDLATNSMPPPPRPNRNDGNNKPFKGSRAMESTLNAPSKPVGGDDPKGGRIRFSLNKSAPRKTPLSRVEQADRSSPRIPTGPAAMQKHPHRGPASQQRQNAQMNRNEPPPPPPPQQHQQHQQAPIKPRRPSQKQISRYPSGQVDKEKKSCYERVTMVGEGTYGRVYKAMNKSTKQFVALKRIRLENERDGFPITAMREMRILQNLEHKNIVCLLETMVEFNEFYMVFEYMDHDLTGILNHPTFVLTEAHIKHLAKQFFEGLEYLHHRGVLHRDIKGSNILLNNEGELKIADFGLARFYNKKKRGLDYTNRIITLWYRGPEILLGATNYNDKVDMWSAGCLFVELFTKSAIFPGRDEIDQLEKIYDIMGTPTVQVWPSVREQPWYHLIKPAEPFKPSRFKEIFKDNPEKALPDHAYNLAKALLSYDPDSRLSCTEALAHPYFHTDPQPEPPLHIRDIQGEWHEYESKNRKRKEQQEAKEREREKRDHEKTLLEKSQEQEKSQQEEQQPGNLTQLD